MAQQLDAAQEQFYKETLAKLKEHGITDLPSMVKVVAAKTKASPGWVGCIDWDRYCVWFRD